MPSLTNIWTHIVEWFQDRQDRRRLLLNFNRSAREAFLSGQAPVLLEARVSEGNKSCKHQFSDFSKKNDTDFVEIGRRGEQ